MKLHVKMGITQIHVAYMFYVDQNVYVRGTLNMSVHI